MARGTTLTTLLIMCRNELGYNSNSTTDDGILTGLLNNKQLWYTSTFDWPFLRTRIDVTLTAGTRFYTLPAFDYERPHAVDVYFNRIFRPLIYGIKDSDYNLINSILTPPIMIDPVRKWLIISNAEGAIAGGPGSNQFEVWPVPVTSDDGNKSYFMRFVGQAVITTMVSGSDTALLDDLLLVKSVCGDLLVKRESPDGQLKLIEAQKRFTQLQSAYPQRDTTFKVGEGNTNYPHRWRPGDKVVALAP